MRIMNNICQLCKKNNAEIKCVIVVDGVRTEKRVCQECARKAGIVEQNKMNRKRTRDIITRTDSENELFCPGCKLTYSLFLKTGLLGCSQCYSTFSAALTDILKGIHSASYHKGRGLGEENTFDVAQLKWKLSEAVRQEDFESAARLRDEIKLIEKESN